MPEVLAKPKSRAQQIRDLKPYQVANFTLEEYGYIRSLVSREIGTEYPLRFYKVSKKEGTTKVSRLEDVCI